MTSTILALIDGWEFSRPVLDLAAWAATRNRAAVRLLHVLPPKSLPRWICLVRSASAPARPC